LSAIRTLIALAILTSVALAAESASLPQPAARYTFDAEFGVTEPDAAGMGPTALIVRDWPGRPLSRRVPGLFGRALRPTARGFVRTTFPAGEAFTVSFWLRPEKDDAASVFRCADLFRIGIRRGAPVLEARIGPRGAGGRIKLGEWTCVVLRSDGTRMSLFLGEKKAGEAVVHFREDPRGQEVIVTNPGGAHHQYEGLVDEVRIYDRALSDEEVAVLVDPKRCMAALPPSVDAGISHTVYLPQSAGKVGRVEVALEGRVDDAAGSRWQVLKAPAGAEVRFADPAAPRTAATLARPGDYVLALDASNDVGRARSTTRLAVFPPHRPRTGKPAEDARVPGTVGDPTRKPWGKQPAYAPEFVKKHFPPLDIPHHWEGFAKARFTPPPPAYQHPRIFFGPDQLDDMRRRLRTTRAGRAARAKLESLLQMRLGDLSPERPLPPYFQFKRKGDNKSRFDGGAAATYCFAAWFALIDADTARARQVIDGAVRIADDQLAAIAAVPPDKRTDWRNVYHNILGRYATSYVYDFLYPWMTLAEQDKLRRVIAGCTAGKWSIGMFAVSGHGTSNWQSWVTGDLLANVLAIEGEDGFDPVVYEEAANAMRRFYANGLFADGAMLEGMGKNSLAAQNMLALAKRGRFDLASEHVYRHLAMFRLHTMQPYGYRFIADDLWGGSRNSAHIADAAVLKFAYPEDPVVDFVYRNVAGDDYGWRPRGSTYSYSSDLVACWTALDWAGDPDWNRNAATALKDEPLRYFSNTINLVTARTAWRQDAAYLYFLPRMLGGHPSPARGTFVFSALGRDWTLYPTGHNDKTTLQHSVVTIDGKSAGTQWARMLACESVAEAVFTACDLREPYSRLRPSGATLNDYRLVKNEAPPANLPLWQLPHWYDGDRPSDAAQIPGHMIPPGRKSETTPGKLVRAAWRAAGLVRGPQPYVLIVDDLNVDGKPHDYRWQVVLPPDLVCRVGPGGRDVTATDPESGRRLLVRLLKAGGEVTASAGQLPAELSRHTGKLSFVALETRCPAPAFTVLLTALAPDQAPPETSWEGDTLRVAGDCFKFTPADDGRRRVVLSRDGKEILRW
jgi:hypothetical protein